MAKKKLQRFADLAKMPHVFQTPDGLPGHWHSRVFHNRRPITLELGCGRGDLTLALAIKLLQRNFIGVDLKGARLWNGAKQAQLQGLANVAFLRIFIENIGEFFSPAETDEIWITFPDPYPAYSKRHKRLTSPRFLTLYQKILKPGGRIHLKTDNEGLFRYTQTAVVQQGGVIHQAFVDLDAHPTADDRLFLPTRYEQTFRKKGAIIRYLCFSVPPFDQGAERPWTRTTSMAVNAYGTH
ncbi:MAG TPA: tRNA (guanosine(46)-N7)-methyltransferase TrmB [bacterium]|nr:tRNA (guanosine(46)-N7)-methyltransferase TrmB [bacterium]